MTIPAADAAALAQWPAASDAGDAPVLPTPPLRLRAAALVTLAGNGIPALLALVMLPVLAARLGTDLFGFFMLAWATVGLSSLLDLGLGRAIAHYAAGEIGLGGPDADTRLVGAALTALGITAVGVTGVVACGWAVYRALDAAASVGRIGFAALPLIACVPFAVLTSGVRGVIEGRQRFAVAAGLRAVTAPLFILIPAGAAIADPRPMTVALGFLAARVMALLVHVVAERRFAGLLRARHFVRVAAADLRTVARYCGWMSVSNLLGGALGYLDRIALAVFAPLAAAAHYSAPFELVSRLLVVPGSITTALFPKIAAARGRPDAVRAHVRDAYRLCALAMLPLCLAATVLAHTLMSAWMGRGFADASADVLRWVGGGLFANAMAQVPLAAMQAAGRPRGAARVHLLEVVPSALLFALLVRAHGATGAAIAWSIRAGADWLLLHLAWRAASRRVEPA